MSKRVPIYLTERQCEAALAAINAMLASEHHAGDWPHDVTAKDLDGAADKIAKCAAHHKAGAQPEPGV